VKRCEKAGSLLEARAVLLKCLAPKEPPKPTATERRTSLPEELTAVPPRVGDVRKLRELGQHSISTTHLLQRQTLANRKSLVNLKKNRDATTMKIAKCTDN